MTKNANTLSHKEALDLVKGLPNLLTGVEAATALGISVVTLRRRIRDGSLRAIRTRIRQGGRFRLLKIDVAALLVEMSR